MSRPLYCRAPGGNNARSVHLAAKPGGVLSPRCNPSLGTVGDGFDKCRGPATCRVCQGLERSGR